MNLEKTVLCYLQKDEFILMLYRNKKINDINFGKWIGVGGHIEEEETIEQALKREVYEETGCVLVEYNKRGIVDFYYNDVFKEKMYIFTSNEFVGEISKCDEGELSWIQKDNIYDLSLWEGDKIFLDILLNETVYFEIELYYENDKLVRSKRIR